MKKLDILGVKISLGDEREIQKEIRSWLKKKKQRLLVTPNPEMVMVARKDLLLKKILNEADLAIPDGIGLVLASKLLYGKRGIKKRITGVDLMEKICSWLSSWGGSAFFLGAQPGVAEECARRLQEKYPSLKVAGCFAGWAEKSRDVQTRKKVLSLLKKNGFSLKKPVDFLFVAYGAGRQEKWIRRNLHFLPVKAAMGVGGSFDFISGRVKRAPLWLRKIGLEWFWRLLCQPWRWRRQIILPVFVATVLQEKVKSPRS